MTRGRLLLPTTVAATFVLLLLGIYTAAIGAGLTCDGRWPLCDGAVFGLFPANWTSFVEWVHRFVAMITGFLILGSWAIVWRSDADRIARWCMTIAVALLPVQVWLGAETVLQYEVLILTAHFLTALAILGGLLLGTWVWADAVPSDRRRRWLLIGTLVGTVPFVLLTPHAFVVHSGPVQIAYYAIGLAMFAGLLIVLADAWIAGRSPIALFAGIGVGTLSVQLVAGRLVRSSIITAIDWGGALVLVVVLVIAIAVSTDVGPRLSTTS